MRRKLCLGCSLAGAWLYHLLLAEITFSFWIYNSFMSQKNIVYVTEIISLPLVSGIMLLCSASLYMLMLTLGSHRPDSSVLGLTLFMYMMKFEFSCQSLELISRIAQPVCLKTSRRMQLSFTQPTADIFYSSFSFIFLDEASTLTFSAAKLVQATFLQVPGALFSEFFSKTFPSAAHPKNFSCPRVK